MKCLELADWTGTATVVSNGVNTGEITTENLKPARVAKIHLRTVTENYLLSHCQYTGVSL